MGDEKWRGLLDLHDDLASRLADATGGHLIKSTGDGVLATFDGPGRAIRFATTTSSTGWGRGKDRYPYG